MKQNLQKIIPLLFSIIIFSSVFVFFILLNSENSENKLQLSPRSYLYYEKFGMLKHYSEQDVSGYSFFNNVRINLSTGVSEPKITGNPINKNILAVSANDFSLNNNSARIFISKDMGANWNAKEIPLSSKFNKSSYSDPWLEYDTEGNLYYVTVQRDAFNSSREAIYFTRSTDNGDTWEAGCFVNHNEKESIYLDRPKICIDKTSPLKNSIYVTWIEIRSLKSFIMFSKSIDGGITFTSPVSVENYDVDYCSMTCGLKGELFIAYLKDENKICIKKSTDAGARWIHEFNCIDIIPSGIKTESQFVIKNKENKGIRINSEPGLAISEDGDLLITYSASDKKTDIADIYFTKIENNTDEIRAPLKVNSDHTWNDQYLPAMTANGSNIFILYQDSRGDVDNILTETYISVSTDGGLSFKDEKLSTSDFNPSSVAVGKYFGDYNSCIVSNGNFIGVWTDGRNNNFDIYAGIFNINDLIKNKSH